MADLNVDRRTELMRILLYGYDESDGRVAKILREAGYLQGRQSFCVVAVRSVDPVEMLNSERARRMVDTVDQILRKHSINRIIDIHENSVIAVISDVHRVSGWTVAKQALNERVSQPLMDVGNAALVGISRDIQATSHIPGAYQEALMALDLATVAKRVIRISELSVREILLQSAGAELVRVLPDWSPNFIAADTKAGGKLVDTIRAYADANMNVLKAGARLSVHPNTVYFRLQKIAEISGLDGRSYHQLSELLLVADCAKYQNGTISLQD